MVDVEVSLSLLLCQVYWPLFVHVAISWLALSALYALWQLRPLSYPVFLFNQIWFWVWFVAFMSWLPVFSDFPALVVRAFLLLSHPSMLYLALQCLSLVDQPLLPYLYNLVIFKEPAFEALSRYVDLSFPILNAQSPLSFVITAINPVHFPETTSQVTFIVPLVDISTCPSKDSITPLLIISIISIISIAVSNSFLPCSLSISETVYEVSFEVTAV